LEQHIKRGNVVTVSANGHYGCKPRPALVLQSDLFSTLGSVTICLLTTERLDAPLLRLIVEPSSSMVDKIVTVPRNTISPRIGMLDHELMVRVDRSLAVSRGIV
jgi:mRNA interferase MazF